MKKHKKGLGAGKTVALLSLGLLGLCLTLAMLLQGTDLKILNPKGMIASEQMNLIIFACVVMLVAAVPTIGSLYVFAWKYRESNAKATYDSHTRPGVLFNFAVWAIPTVFMLILATVMWSSTHRLEPKRALASDKKPVTIQVIALRWKWLFLYPEQQIATVNYVQIPVDTPVRFELTADEAPMNSFWIPHLGGQLYAMTGHTNPLNLIADQEGDYPGSAAEISGKGFAGMRFTARASSTKDFDAWVASMQQSPQVLSAEEYAELLNPSEDHPVASYAAVEPGLYESVLQKYSGGHAHASHSEGHE